MSSRSLLVLLLVPALLCCEALRSTTSAAGFESVQDDALVVDRVDDPRVVDRLLAVGGDGARLRGRLLQSNDWRIFDAEGIDSIAEWFVERSDGSVVAVAIAGDSESGQGSRAVRAGQMVEVAATPVGTLESKARDGVVRRWPLFVGRPSPMAAPSGGAAAVVAGTVLLAGIWWIVRRIVRRPREIPTRFTHAEAADSPMDLPEDPAEAMAVLERRARAQEVDS